MKTALDTNVLSAIWSKETGSLELVKQLAEARRRGSVVICGAVFAETLANPLVNESFIQKFLDDTGIQVDAETDLVLWREAGIRFARQVRRKRHQAKDPVKRILADYVVGAHALLRADCLVTMEKNRYRTDFPELRLI